MIPAKQSSCQLKRTYAGMKIAFINHPLSFPVPPQRGSVQMWAHAVARRLAQSHQVIVYALRGELPESEWCEDVLYRRVSVPEWLVGTRCRRVLNRTPLLWRFDPWRTLDARSSSVRSRWHNWGYGLAVARDLRRRKCDLVHIMNLFHLVPAIRALNPKAKVVLHMHCEWLTRLNRAFIEPRLKKADLIVGCTEYITERIRQAFPGLANRCRTVFNGVDAGRFVPDSCPMPSGTAKRIVWAGRVSPEKGLHVLLDAFAQVVKRHPEALLEIAGPEERLRFDVLLICDDPAKMAPLEPFYRTKSYVTQLKAQAASLGIADRVIFRGHIGYADLPRYYPGARVLVAPSFSETFGMTLIEAMACEVPVVATRVGGIPHVVANGQTGILVESGDASALSEAILRLLADDNLRESMAKAGRQRVLKLFSWDKVAEDMLRQYKDVCRVRPDHGPAEFLSASRASDWLRTD
jgi:glycosyltransferase involved in cell wall biosynthesis